MVDVDVVVVGAGFAGLGAALELHDAGARVRVVEARDRVGGRVHSVELDNGEVAELGGEWIFAEDEALQAMIDRLGLVASEAGIDYLRREPRGEAAVSMDELDAFLEAADAHLASVGSRRALDGRGPEPGPWRRSSPRGRAGAAARGRSRASCPCRVAAGLARREAGRRSPPSTGGWREGNRSIADAAARLLADVRLGMRAIAIRERAGGVEVDAGDTIDANAAVVAVPVRLVTELALDPPLAADQREAFEGLPMGVASKVAVPLDGDPERCAIQCADLPFWFWVADGADGRRRRVVTSFAGSELPQGPLETATGDPSDVGASDPRAGARAAIVRRRQR